MNNRVRLAYAGRRLKAKGGLAYAYVETDSGNERWYAKPLRGGISVGAVVEFEQDDKGSIIVHSTSSDQGPRHRGEYRDRDAIAGWAAKDAAAVTMDAREREFRKRDREVNPALAGALAELRAAYGKLSGIGERAAFIDYVNASIQGVGRGR